MGIQAPFFPDPACILLDLVDVAEWPPLILLNLSAGILCGRHRCSGSPHPSSGPIFFARQTAGGRQRRFSAEDLACGKPSLRIRFAFFRISFP